jgi:hypothetical protein
LFCRFLFGRAPKSCLVNATSYLPRSASRVIEGAKQKKFVIQSPITFDPAQEEKFDRLYIGTLVKKGT